MNDSPTGRSTVSEVTPLMEKILYEVKRVVVGQDLDVHDPLPPDRRY